MISLNNLQEEDSGVWSSSTIEEGFDLNLPLEGYSKKSSSGSLESAKSFVSFDRNNIVVDALKKSQAEDGYILRIYECKKQRGKVTANLGFNVSKIVECNMMEVEEKELAVKDNSFTFFLKPGEVKTFKIFR